MSDEREILKAAHELVTGLRVAAQRETDAAAIGWVVLCTDEESGSTSAHTDPAWHSELDAVTYAEKFGAEVNTASEGPGHGWVLRVLPLLRADLAGN